MGAHLGSGVGGVVGGVVGGFKEIILPFMVSLGVVVVPSRQFVPLYAVQITPSEIITASIWVTSLCIFTLPFTTKTMPEFSSGWIILCFIVKLLVINMTIVLFAVLGLKSVVSKVRLPVTSNKLYVLPLKSLVLLSTVRSPVMVFLFDAWVAWTVGILNR